MKQDAPLGYVIEGDSEESYSELNGTKDLPSDSYQPSCFFWRQEVRRYRARRNVARLEEIALLAIREFEALRAWVAAHDAVPPEFFAFKAEFAAKSATIEEAQRNGYHSWFGSSVPPGEPVVDCRQRG